MDQLIRCSSSLSKKRVAQRVSLRDQEIAHPFLGPTFWKVALLGCPTIWTATVHWRPLVLCFWIYVGTARRASPEPVKNVYMRPNPVKILRGCIGNYIGKRLSHFQYWRRQLPICFQHIPINFDVIGEMYGFLLPLVRPGGRSQHIPRNTKRFSPNIFPF